MIGRLRGRLLVKQPPQLLLDVGGVGFEVEAPMSTFFNLPAPGETVELHTHLAVRDDALLLFGFSSGAERSLFRELLKVSGVGAKLALTILSGIGPDEFRATVQAGDSDRLTGLPGVGKKTAARLIVEMRDQIGSPGGMVPAGGSGGSDDPVAVARYALVSLGYKPAEADRLLKDLPAEADSEALIRQALKRAVQ